MIVVIGKSGQLAKELSATKSNRDIIFFGREDIDVFNMQNFKSTLDNLSPTVLINASAYTAVDKAESDIDAAYALNDKAVRIMASYCNQRGCRLIHISTDFVFDGEKSTPYDVSDLTNPLGVYGCSKLAGEKAIISTMNDNYTIIRTSWLYSSFGNNFVKTMLRIMNEKNEISIVNDQFGSPTSARGLAHYIWEIIGSKEATFLCNYSDGIVMSWYEFACQIYTIGSSIGLINRNVKITPIKTSEFPTAAKRPKFSALSFPSNKDSSVLLKEVLNNIRS